jgi:pimeloyl-ACP methyl ester carboxylesterase
MKTEIITIDGLRIRYAASSKQHKENLLFLSPLPESVFAFNPMWEGLSSQFNLLAIDLPGFGKSEARKDLFSVKTMADFVVKIIDHFKFEMPHIVGNDIGTPIALFVAALYPQKLKSIIAGGGACVYPLNIDGALKQIIEAPNLDDFRKIPVKDIIDGSLSGMKHYVLPDEIREDYISSYEGGKLFESMEILRAYKTDIPVLDKYINKISIPVLIIWGEKDPIAPVINAEILHERLPKNKLIILEDIGHYTWEDGWERFQAATSSWLNVDYKEYMIPEISN